MADGAEQLREEASQLPVHAQTLGERHPAETRTGVLDSHDAHGSNQAFKDLRKTCGKDKAKDARRIRAALGEGGLFEYCGLRGERV